MNSIIETLRSSAGLRHFRGVVRARLRLLTGKWLSVKPDIECDKQRFGNPGACFTVATSDLGHDSVVISVGIGEDVSFDRALIQTYGMTIHAFDPTPKSLAWLRTHALPDRLHVYPYGLANRDGDVVFYPPRNPAHVSHSAVVRHRASCAGVRCPVRTLGSLMNMIGVAHVDLLKLDIEGAEYEVLEHLAAGPIRPKQIVVEYHHRFPGIGVAATKRSVALLRRLGYRLFDVSPSHEEFSFVYGSSILFPAVTQ